MPGYVDTTLKSCIHPAPSKPQHAPCPWTKPDFGAKIQYAAREYTSKQLSVDEITHVQQVIGNFYYYARAVYHTILTALE